MSTTTTLARPFDDRVRDGVASLLLAGLAGFAMIRLFVVNRKRSKALAKA